MTLSIVIPTLAERRGSARTITGSLMDQAKRSGSDLEVLVCLERSIDRRTTDDAAATKIGVASLARTAAAKRNLGFHASTRSTWVLFVDDDCQPDTDLVERAMRWCRRADVDLVAGGVRGYGGYHRCPRAVTLGRPTASLDGPGGWCAVWGGNLLVRRSAMDAVGPFDEALRRTEDVDLGLRFQIAGRTAVYDEEMSVTHIDGLGGAPSAEEKLVIEQEEVHRMATAYPSAATHLYRTTSQPFRELAVLHRFRSQLAASK